MESILFFLAGAAFGTWYGQRMAGVPFQRKRAIVTALIALVIAAVVAYVMR